MCTGHVLGLWAVSLDRARGPAPGRLELTSRRAAEDVTPEVRFGASGSGSHVSDRTQNTGGRLEGGLIRSWLGVFTEGLAVWGEGRSPRHRMTHRVPGSDSHIHRTLGSPRGRLHRGDGRESLKSMCSVQYLPFFIFLKRL